MLKLILVINGHGSPVTSLAIRAPPHFILYSVAHPSAAPMVNLAVVTAMAYLAPAASTAPGVPLHVARAWSGRLFTGGLIEDVISLFSQSQYTPAFQNFFTHVPIYLCWQRPIEGLITSHERDCDTTASHCFALRNLLGLQSSTKVWPMSSALIHLYFRPQWDYGFWGRPLPKWILQITCYHSTSC